MGIRSTIKKPLVRLRDTFDGRMHPRRRRAAKRRLDDARVESVLFVCLGNICRSPYAEYVFRARSDGSINVASAGFILPGRQPPENAREVAVVRGFDTDDHRSQVVSTDLLSDADAVFIFDRFNVRRLAKETGVKGERVFWLGDFDPQWSGKRAIIDPWGKPVEEFHRTFERIERCVTEVAEVIDGGHLRATGQTP